MSLGTILLIVLILLARRRHPDLATQQELGLRAQWCVGVGGGRHPRALGHGPPLTGSPVSVGFRAVRGHAARRHRT